MRPQIALGVIILALATLVISEHINLTAPVNWTLGTTPVHELHKRHEPADQELWDKHVAKGERLLCLMEVSDNDAGRMLQDTRNPPSAASIWTGTLDDELEKWCWKPYEGVMEIAIDCDFDDDGLRAAFDAFGLDSHPAFDDESNPLPGANICHSTTHLAEGYYDEDPLEEQIYEVDGVRYMATGAYYQFAINTGGAIVGINFMSPRMAAALPYAWGRRPLPQELPKLQFASDVLWGYWVQGNPHFAHDIRSLRLYVGHEVVNPETVALVWRALKIAGRTELEEWPGVSFFLGTAEYKALIGSPIGATAAHMLIGHKAELGLKWITKVTVIKNWVPPGGALPGKLHLFFHIEDVPEGPLPEPAAMGGNKRQAEKTGSEDSHATRVHKIMA